MSETVMADPYENPIFPGSGEEGVVRFHEDGSVSLVSGPPAERPKKAKNSAQIAACADDAIARVTETSLAVYYRIGKNVTVSHRGRDRWLCHTCNGNDRWQNSEHRGCAHIRRVERWAADHPQQREDAA